MTTPQVDCFVPPSPELRERIVRAREAIMAGRALPRAAADGMDLRAFNLILTRPPARNNAFFARGQMRAPVAGIRRVLVLLVDFADEISTQAPDHFNELLFSSGTLATGSVRDFYQEISYNKLVLTGLIAGSGGAGAWFRAPQPKSFYTNANYGFGAYPQNAQRLVEDLVDLAAPFVNYADYDNDGDGVVDALVVVAAGNGAEETGDVNDIWSHKWSITPKTHNGVRIENYNLQPENGRIGVFAHELGHLLCGWPDLYDTDYSSAGTGRWDLMAEGTWNGGGNTPAHPTCWCKVQAGWVNPITISNTTQQVTLAPFATNEIAYKLQVANSSQEYFLVTNRGKTGFDSELPGEGLVIEHVDESRNTNTDETHYLVDIVQADGRQDLNKNANSGDATDAYPTAKNTEFNLSSTPSSRAYDGSDSKVSISGIERSGSNIVADIGVGVGATGSWFYDQKITGTYAHSASQWAWAYIDGLGWRRIKEGLPEAGTNIFVILCEAAANRKKVSVYADDMYIYGVCPA